MKKAMVLLVASVACLSVRFLFRVVPAALASLSLFVSVSNSVAVLFAFGHAFAFDCARPDFSSLRRLSS